MYLKNLDGSKMQPTTELKQRYRQALHDRAVYVTYRPFVESSQNLDELAVEPIVESEAYGDPVNLRALVELSPSKALRAKFGEDQDMDAVVKLAVADAATAGIVFHNGDSFELPDGITYHVVAIRRDKQVKGEYLEFQIAVQYQAGRQ